MYYLKAKTINDIVYCVAMATVTAATPSLSYMVTTLAVAPHLCYLVFNCHTFLTLQSKGRVFHHNITVIFAFR